MDHRNTNQHAWNHEHPWRELKATDEIQAHFLLGLVQAFTNREGNIVKHQDGLRVRAALSAQELSQLRSAQTNHQQELPELLNQTAFNFAKKVAQNINLK